MLTREGDPSVLAGMPVWLSQQPASEKKRREDIKATLHNGRQN
jgi:hypothetical protein